MQEANLIVKGARMVKGTILEKQWVRSPLTGLVSEVSVKFVTAKRIAFEFVLLGEGAKVGKTGRI